MTGKYFEASLKRIQLESRKAALRAELHNVEKESAAAARSAAAAAREEFGDLPDAKDFPFEQFHAGLNARPIVDQGGYGKTHAYVSFMFSNLHDCGHRMFFTLPTKKPPAHGGAASRARRSG